MLGTSPHHFTRFSGLKKGRKEGEKHKPETLAKGEAWDTQAQRRRGQMVLLTRKNKNYNTVTILYIGKWHSLRGEEALCHSSYILRWKSKKLFFYPFISLVSVACLRFSELQPQSSHSFILVNHKSQASCSQIRKQWSYIVAFWHDPPWASLALTSIPNWIYVPLVLPSSPHCVLKGCGHNSQHTRVCVSQWFWTWNVFVANFKHTLFP